MQVGLLVMMLGRNPIGDATSVRVCEYEDLGASINNLASDCDDFETAQCSS